MEKIRWGILGPGAIAHRFAEGLASLADAELVAVGSRSAERAEAFAKKYGAERHYGSYAELARDPLVDAIYVATPHSLHRENSIDCLEAGKAVLCEKPFTINARELREIVDCARSNGVFLMEAMWTRFLPAVRRARQWVADGAIGEPRMVLADFCFRAEFDATSRVFDPALGGGGLLDVGVYVVSLASMVFGSPPEQVAGFAEIGQTGIDEQAVLALDYGGGHRLASLSCGVRTNSPQEARILGSEGTIYIEQPFWQAKRARLFVGGEEKEVAEEEKRATGYEFEAVEVGRCLRAGLTESAEMPLDESIAIMETLDRVRALWGMKYPME